MQLTNTTNNCNEWPIEPKCLNNSLTVGYYMSGIIIKLVYLRKLLKVYRPTRQNTMDNHD